MNAEKLTQKSAEAIRTAQALAQEYGNPQIEQIHLLSSPEVGQRGESESIAAIRIEEEKNGHTRLRLVLADRNSKWRHCSRHPPQDTVSIA